MPTRSSAGGYQQERYEHGLRNWRRRVLPRLRWITAPFVVAGLAYLVFGPPTRMQFLAGAIAGGFVALYMWVRDEPPEHVRRHGQGAEGERSTAKVLEPLLAAGWHVVHDVDTGRGNRDHVLVGPAGVFLLDSKKLGGTVTVDADVVRVERLDDERDSYQLPKLARSLRGEAATLSRELLADVGIRVWVSAVVVIWSPFPAGAVDGDNIAFVHGDQLTAWLQTRSARYDASLIARVIDHLTLGQARAS